MQKIELISWVTPFFGLIMYTFFTGFISEKYRQQFHASIVCFASATYLGHSFGQLEALMATVMFIVSFLGHRNWKFIALAWFLHGSVDLLHHFNNDVLLKWYFPSSFECWLIDMLFAIYFFFGAPNWARKIFPTKIIA